MRSAERRPLIRPQRGERLRLTVRHIYILPTGFGWLWLGGAALLQVVGIQLQSNGSLLLSFLLLGLFLLALHLTAFNLLGLELACGEPAPGFAGTTLHYPLRLRSRCRRLGVELAFRSDPRALGPFQTALESAAEPDPPPPLEAGERLITVPWLPERRGLQRPGPLRLRTTAPLGLFRAWSVWEPLAAQLVYPARRSGPVQERPAPLEGKPGVENGMAAAAGEEEWCDLRPHRPEDGSARLAWKILARGRGAHSKVFAARPPLTPMLAPATGLPVEEALEHLCARICALNAAGIPFGLRLSGRTIPPGSGAAHRERCLTALALLP
jgi:uncharacterized protein (DUF58 family)